MKVGYGSENSEGTAFVRRVEVTRRPKAQLAKKVIAAVGVAAFVGCGYVAFQSQTSGSHAALRAGTQAAEAAMILEVDASASTRTMQTLLSGARFQLRVPGKDNLCVDDGGGMTSGQTKVHLWTCVDNHINQVFVYDPRTNQIRSAGKKNLCIDDGGAEYAGHAKFHMFECDPRNINQKFVYEPATMMFRNPTKNNLCMDDGGATYSGQTQFQLWGCDSNNPNQRFALQPIDQPNWRVEHPILLSSEEFMMRVPGKDNRCVDDGGGVASAQTQFHLWTCDPNNLNQVFRYDPATFTIRSSTKANLCVDDGGGLSAGQTMFHLYECNPSNNNQKFVYDWASQMFRNPTKANMCMDDGGGVSSGQTKFQLWDCDVSNGNQHFEIMPRILPPPIIHVDPAAPVYHVPAFLMGGEEVLIFMTEKPGMCVDDGGGSTNGQTKFLDQKCNKENNNQIFFYDAINYQFRSARKPNMCLDDGGGMTAGETQFHLWECHPDNINQRFVYEEATQHLRNPTKGLCMDDGGSQHYTLQPCSGTSNQRFTMMWRSEMNDIRPIDIPVWPVEHPVLLSSEEFMMRVPGKDNLCVDDGGGVASAQTQFHLWTCDPNNLNQVFRYDPATFTIRSSTKANLCVDDGGGLSAGQTKFHLYECDPSNNNQKFVYDWASQMLRNPTKANMCMDDGGGVSSGQTKFQLWDCDVSNGSQHFEIIPRGAFGIPIPHPPVDPPLDFNPVLAKGGKFLLRQVNKGNMCVDDGGGHTSGETKFILQPCDPRNSNQQFMYNIQEMQMHSVAKPGLCIDDGGAMHDGETKFHLWTCDPSNNNQKFVYDPISLMFHNPTKQNLCMDDGGGLQASETHFHLWTCDMSNFNQKFEVMGVQQLDIEVPDVPVPIPTPAPEWPVDHPLLTSGEEFMMRVPGKDNLCVDDGGGVASAQTQFHLWTCDPNNLNQVFRYDPATFTIRSSTKANLCVDDGGGLSAGQTMFHLYECDPSNNNQKFVYDWASQMLRNPTKANMCMDDGGGVSSGQTKFQLWDCDVSNGNQHFELIRRPMPDTPVIPTETPTVEPTIGPTIEPTVEPTVAPTIEPTIEPTVEPTIEPTVLPTFKPSEEITEGDWNLLAPSHNTLPSVNADGSVEVTAQEIFDFLLGIKDKAEIKYQSTMYKYRRTMKCVTDGLQTLAKTSVTLDEYHELVMWMYEHCNPDGPNPQPPPPPTSVPVVTSGSGSKSHDPLNPGSSSPPERMYMTKLEFYYKIKEYFMKEEDMMLAGAEAERLHSEMAVAQQKKLIACIEEASNRYGRYMEYELVEHFKSAIKWVQEECVTAV